MREHLPFGIVPSFLVLALTLVTASPAPAQSASASASAGQYGNSFGSANAADADTGDIPPAFSNNVTNGAEAAKDAMADGGALAAQASSPDEAVPTNPAAASPAAENPAAENLTVLPDTGGASFLALGSGLLLVAGGLCARRMLRR